MSRPAALALRAVAILAALASVVPARTRASAQEWPRFRGPNGSGTSPAKGLPSSFGVEENLRWRTPFAAGHSSPVLGEGCVFVTGADEKGLVVACLARDTGALRWERRLERTSTQEVYAANGSATPSPTTDGKNVYAFFPELGLVSFDQDGKERWKLALGPFVSFYGMAGSPILAGDTLVLLCDQQQGSFLIGVDAKTGAQRWRTERKGLIESWTTPVLWPAEKPASVVVFGTYFVCAYSLATGAEEWRHGGVGYTPVCSPVVWERPQVSLLFASVPFQAEQPMPSFEALSADADKDKDQKLTRAELAGTGYDEHFGWADANRDDLIVAAEWKLIVDGMASQDYGLVAFELGAKEPRELWRHKRGLPGIATPLVADGVLYLIKSGGMLTTLDAASGKELGFLRLEEAGGEYDASPIAADGKLFLASQEGRVTVLAAGPEPKILSRCDLGEPIHGTPALGGDALFVRTDAALYCFGAKD
jgi:outer membrane protein assembly factor BamB